MEPRNVLVLPAGTEIGLEICRALKSCKEVRLFGAGQDLNNHARFVFDRYETVPSIHEEGWLDSLNDLSRQWSIDYIFPAHDDVIVALADKAGQTTGRVISSPPDACHVTRSKRRTYQRLAGRLPVPDVFERPEDIRNYPVFVKPERGQGSQGATTARNADELAIAMNAVVDPLVCEYLPGDEYTIDCFSDRDEGLLFAGARRRNRMRNGIAVNTTSVELPGIDSLAQTIGGELGLRGAWFFQLKRAADGRLKLLEVAPRIAGSMATHRVMGINFPLLSIFEAERLPVKIVPNRYEVEVDRALENRYRAAVQYQEAYIDLDDTLVVHDRVNLDMIRLVFQCLNEGKKVVLITRHRGDIEQMLARHRLAGLFHGVIHIKQEERKSSYIPHADAIFIDDSFVERMDVARTCGILTFDCSMIELLLH
jgi:hypothetical protein